MRTVPRPFIPLTAVCVLLTGCPPVDIPQTLDEANARFDSHELLGGDSDQIVFAFRDVQFSSMREVLAAVFGPTEGIGFLPYTDLTITRVDLGSLTTKTVATPFDQYSSLLTDGHWLVDGYPTVSILDLDTGMTLSIQSADTYVATASRPFLIIWSLDGEVSLTDALTGEVLARLGEAGVASAAFSPTHAAVALWGFESPSARQRILADFHGERIVLVDLSSGTQTTAAENLDNATVHRIVDGQMYWSEGGYVFGDVPAAYVTQVFDGDTSPLLDLPPVSPSDEAQNVVDAGPDGVIRRVLAYAAQEERFELVRPDGTIAVLSSASLLTLGRSGEARFAGSFIIYYDAADQTWKRAYADGSGAVAFSPLP